jgi:hypothetical protein
MSQFEPNAFAFNPANAARFTSLSLTRIKALLRSRFCAATSKPTCCRSAHRRRAKHGASTVDSCGTNAAFGRPGESRYPTRLYRGRGARGATRSRLMTKLRWKPRDSHRGGDQGRSSQTPAGRGLDPISRVMGAADYESGGQEFESLRARQKLNNHRNNLSARKCAMQNRIICMASAWPIRARAIGPRHRRIHHCKRVRANRIASSNPPRSANQSRLLGCENRPDKTRPEFRGLADRKPPLRALRACIPALTCRRSRHFSPEPFGTSVLDRGKRGGPCRNTCLASGGRQKVVSRIALAEPAEPIHRERRTVWNLVIEVELAKPAVGQVHGHFLAEPTFMADAVTVTDQQHSDHQLGIDRRPANVAVKWPQLVV